MKRFSGFAALAALFIAGTSHAAGVSLMAGRVGAVDVATDAAAVKAAGGRMDGDPKPFGETGMVIGFGTDPAGNRFELIQQPKR